MERLNERIRTARDALAALGEVLVLERSAITCDAAMLRFKYAFRTGWKAAQRFLRQVQGVEEGSPKSVIRASFRVALLDENQARLAMEMATDSSLAIHAYDEQLADKIYSRLLGYTELIESWLTAMEKRLSQ